MIMGSDIEKALALYDRPDIHDCILDFSNEEHVRVVQQVIATFPEAARRALEADERVRGLEAENRDLRCRLDAAVWLIFGVEQEDDMRRMERRWVEKKSKEILARIGMKVAHETPETETELKQMLLKRRTEVAV